jgi:hypothetical protein
MFSKPEIDRLYSKFEYALKNIEKHINTNCMMELFINFIPGYINQMKYNDQVEKYVYKHYRDYIENILFMFIFPRVKVIDTNEADTSVYALIKPIHECFPSEVEDISIYQLLYEEYESTDNIINSTDNIINSTDNKEDYTNHELYVSFENPAEFIIGRIYPGDSCIIHREFVKDLIHMLIELIPEYIKLTTETDSEKVDELYNQLLTQLAEHKFQEFIPCKVCSYISIETVQDISDDLLSDLRDAFSFDKDTLDKYEEFYKQYNNTKN